MIDEDRATLCGAGGGCEGTVECVCPDVKPNDNECAADALCETDENCACITFLTEANKEVECAAGGACEGDSACVCIELSPGDAECTDDCVNCDCDTFITEDNSAVECASGSVCEETAACGWVDCTLITDAADDACNAEGGFCTDHANCDVCTYIDDITDALCDSECSAHDNC